MRAVLAAALALLAGCSGAEQPGNAIQPTPTPSPAAPVPAATSAAASADLPAPELEGVGFARGRWSFKASASGSAALFGDGAGAPVFAIRCDPPAHRIVFALGGTPPGVGGSMQIITDTGAMRLDARVPDTGVASVEAAIPAGAPFAQALAAPPRRIGIRLEEGPVLLVPGDQSIAQAVRSCR